MNVKHHKRRARVRGIGIAAACLGVRREHLQRVLAGKVVSQTLLARYAALQRVLDKHSGIIGDAASLDQVFQKLVEMRQRAEQLSLMISRINNWVDRELDILAAAQELHRPIEHGHLTEEQIRISQKESNQKTPRSKCPQNPLM